ncbi:hypothetical protein TNCV_4476241 [Trichonephila clavipes]|nr:hypothetical protein TNCV_4476241 [Trichonephila clavipes]
MQLIVLKEKLWEWKIYRVEKKVGRGGGPEMNARSKTQQSASLTTIPFGNICLYQFCQSVLRVSHGYGNVGGCTRCLGVCGICNALCLAVPRATFLRVKSRQSCQVKTSDQAIACTQCLPKCGMRSLRVTGRSGGVQVAAEFSGDMYCTTVNYASFYDL